MVTTDSDGNDQPSPSGKRTPGTLREEVSVSRLDGLIALRQVLAQEIEDGPPVYSGRGPVPASQTASLARQLRDVMAEIEALERDLPKGSVADDLAAKRDRRRAALTESVDQPAGETGL